jgi:hypothetical protein
MAGGKSYQLFVNLIKIQKQPPVERGTTGGWVVKNLPLSCFFAGFQI